jgi:integrase
MDKRRRKSGVALPRGVQAVRKGGKVYYYWAPGRSTARAGKRLALGSDPWSPEFSARLRELGGDLQGSKGTLSALIAAYKLSPKWTRLRPASKHGFGVYLDRLEAEAGDRMVAALTASDIYALQDGMQATPHAANLMLSVLRIILQFAVKRDYRKDNPAMGIERLETDGEGARPWPEEGYRFVLEHGSLPLRRLAFLGRACGQRAGDLVRMRACDLVADGINLRIGKRRERAHFVPLSKMQMAEIRSWGVDGLDLLIKSPTGKPLTAGLLNLMWNRWRNSAAAKPIRDLKMTIHGLRATAVVDRRLAGTEDNGIAAEIGMSVPMVARYSRFADKAAEARASRDRRERATNEIENSLVRLKTLDR